MNSKTMKSSRKYAVSELTKAGLVTALYITVTFVLSVISFGAIQLRLSEMFNYLALYHKRYIVAVTLGVVIVNFLSPMWVLDVPVGGIATLAVLLCCRLATKKLQSMIWKYIITAIIFSCSMFTVAIQLYIMLEIPFWITYGMVATGELLSMTIGGVIIFSISKKIDLTL